MPFWTTVKPVDDRCKFSLCRVCILWTCEFSWKSLFEITKRSMENIYCDGRGNIWSCLNNGHVSYLLEFVMIRITRFWILKMLTLWWEFPQNIIPNLRHPTESVGLSWNPTSDEVQDHSFVFADFCGLQGFYDVVKVYKTTGHHIAEQWCCWAGGGGGAAAPGRQKWIF